MAIMKKILSPAWAKWHYLADSELCVASRRNQRRLSWERCERRRRDHQRALSANAVPRSGTSRDCVSDAVPRPGWPIFQMPYQRIGNYREVEIFRILKASSLSRIKGFKFPLFSWVKVLGLKFCDFSFIFAILQHFRWSHVFPLGLM